MVDYAGEHFKIILPFTKRFARHHDFRCICTVTVTFDFKGQSYILFPWLVMQGYMSKSTSYDQQLVRYCNL